MKVIKMLNREIKFTARDRSVWLWLAMVFCLSAVSVSFGLAEVELCGYGAT